jgi:hypothetical protein
MSAEKANPWLDEGTRYDKETKKSNIRELKFQDNKTHTVRILPAKKVDEFPFFGYKQHWIPQNASTIGKPITHGIDERCAVCEWLSIQWDEVHRLKEEEDMTDKSPEVEAILSKISKVSAKTRYDMNVIHREDLYVVNEETGEKTLAQKRMCVGGTVYKEVFGFAKKWGSPSNQKDGYDLEIVTSGSKERREYRTIPDRDISPLTEEEIALIEKSYDLKALRKYSTLADIQTVLENAKTPYNEILDFVKESNTETPKQNKPKDSVSDVEKEIEKEVKKTEAKQEPVKETVKPVETAKEPEPKQSEPAQLDDEHNIEVYECKGDFDENDKMCSDCPVKNDCEAVHPFYVKGKQAGIDIHPRRLTKDVIEDVKKTEKVEEPAAQPSRRGKKIPF